MVSTIALGADHAGYGLKEALKGWLIDHNYQVLDLGTHSTESVDYPDYAALVARVGRGSTRSSAASWSAAPASACPSRPTRSRACARPCARDLYTARMSREHNDANVLVLGGRLMGADMAADILQAWLETDFAGGRHARRVDKIADVESPPRPDDGAHP